MKPTPFTPIRLPVHRALAALLVALGCLPLACRADGGSARAEATALKRQTRGLRDLLAAADEGTLFPADRLAVGIKAELVRELIQRRLPIETVLLQQLRVRLETAEVALENGQSLVTVAARVFPVQREDAFAEVALVGGLRRFDVDPGSGMLTARLELDRVEVRRLHAGTLEPGFVRTLTEGIAGRGLEDLGEVLSRVEIPVRLDQAIEFAGFAEGAVSVPGARLPLRVAVAHVVPMVGRLWILLDISAGGKAHAPAARGRP